MKRLLAATILMCLSLTACHTSSFSLPPTLPETITIDGTESRSWHAPFSGSWQVKAPDWLEVTPAYGSGDWQFAIRALREKATPLRADLPHIEGNLEIHWTQGNRTGVKAIPVTLPQLLLEGKISEKPVTGTDIGHFPSVNTNASKQHNGYLLTYTAPKTAQSYSQNNSEQTFNSLKEEWQLPKLKATPITKDTILIHPTPRELARLKQEPNIQLVKNLVFRAQETTTLTPVIATDQYAPLQWASHMLGYGAVWRDMKEHPYTRPVTVAVIDSGVRYDHPDLTAALLRPTEGAIDLSSLKGVDTDPTDTNHSGSSHGTHVTGILAASWKPFVAPCSGCSSSGVAGVLGPESAVRILPIRVLNDNGETDEATLALAIRYAAGIAITVAGKTYHNPHPAQVINMSLGGNASPREAQVICQAVNDAMDKGALLVAASGNDVGDKPFYPASCDGVISVGAVTLGEGAMPQHADYSNRLDQLTVSAPGGSGLKPTYFNGGFLNGEPMPDGILSTDWNYETTPGTPRYSLKSGTSQAAPQVSALAALLLSKGETQNAKETMQRIIDTATDIGTQGHDSSFGYGLINPAAALNAKPVSSALALRITSTSGKTWEPLLDNLGYFKAYLPEGLYTIHAGQDGNGNGIAGEVGERSTKQQLELNHATSPVKTTLRLP